MLSIDSRLLNDGEILGKFDLCHVLLMKDANYPWCVLVPDRENKVEVFDLTEKEQSLLQLESTTLLGYLKKEFNADKMNVAALGNVVSQLHIHHVVRFKNDIAWPAPIWGAHPSKEYSNDIFEELRARLIKGFSTLNLSFVPK